MTVPPIQDSERDLVLTALRDRHAINAADVSLVLGRVGSAPRIQLIIDQLVREGKVVRERQSISGEEHGGMYRVVASPSVTPAGTR